METGVYEQLINSIFQLKIKELGSSHFYIGKEVITPQNAAKYLSNYLYQVIQCVIQALPQDQQKVEKCTQLVNDIIIRVGRTLDIEDLQDKLIEAPANILTAVVDLTKSDYPDVAGYIQNVMPSTRLSQSALFTGRSSEISMYSELQKEILTSDEICLLVSFIKKSGLDLIKKQLSEFVSNNHKLRIITTTYTGATQYKAIAELAALPNTQIKISYNSDIDRLHAKAYLFLRNSQFHTAYVGSSNLSEPALRNGLEWNIKVTQSDSPHIIANIRNSFESYWNDDSFEDFVLGRDDERLKAALKDTLDKKIDYSVLDLIQAKSYQQEVLEKLTAERELHGHYKNLVVAATGTGKTVIAAFDYKRFKESSQRSNFLFVVHREEIIKQARDTFRRVLHDENFGEIWVGGKRPATWSHVFASKDSLNNSIDGLDLANDYYDYIIVDEAHHISADTYQKIIARFKPKILLGLTATPERMDGQDITKFFDDRISAEIRLTTALNNGLLSPFHYYGITDNTDLSEVKWDRGRYMPTELSKVYTFNDRRTDLIWRKMEEYLEDCHNVRALCFCVDQQHAEYMQARFTLSGLKSGVLTSRNSNNERTGLLRKLRSKQINYLFVVDLFNEGVDIPDVDTILFLRPTESLTVFLQQLGRGLRKAKDKEFLTVLDFVGQYRAEYNFADRFRALLGKTSMSIKEEVEHDFPHVPLNCNIKLESVAKQYIIDNINKSIAGFKRGRIIDKIKNFEKEHEQKLTLTNFLKVYPIPLANIYKPKDATWYESCRLAEIELPCELTMINELRFAVLKKWISTDSYTYFSFIHSLAQKRFKVDVSELSVIEQKQLAMLYYDLYDTAGKFTSLQKMLNYLSDQNLFIDEVEQLMKLFMQRCDVVEKMDNSLISLINPLRLHGRYTKAQIQVAIGTSTIEKKSSNREGVERNKDLNLEAMYVDIIKDREEGSNTNYNDFAISKDLFHWETQNSVSPSSKAGQNYINGTQTMLLFIREQSTSPEDKTRTMGYVYLGEVTLKSYEGSKPMEIVWKLKTPMAASIFSFAGKYMAIAK